MNTVEQRKKQAASKNGDFQLWAIYAVVCGEQGSEFA